MEQGSRSILMKNACNMLISFTLFFAYCKLLQKNYHTYQHSGSQIKFLLKLSDKYVCSHQVICIVCFNFTNHVCQPFKLLLRSGYPNEIDLM